MELPALIYLVALIDTGSAAGAAEALGVGSSTVNHAVAALEQAMAAPLLSRNPRRRHAAIVPTAHGQSLYRASVTLLHWCLTLVDPKPAERDQPVPQPMADTPSGPGLPNTFPDTLPDTFPDGPFDGPAPSAAALRTLLDTTLTLRMIGYFLTVCEVGSIAGAARKLSLTQPTLTRQVRRLESILGAALLDRSAHGVRPTAAARALLQGCRRADRTYRRIMRDETLSYFRQFRSLRLASMMPSSSDSSLTILLANLVRFWRDRRYQPTLVISTIAAPTLVDGLLRAEYDAGLTDLVDIPPCLDHIDLESSALFLVSGRDRAAPARGGARAVIAAGVLAVPAFGTGLRYLTDQFLDHEAITPAAMIETQSVSLMLRLVVDGTCCALMPAGSFRAHEVDALPLPRRYRMTTRLIWKKDHANMASIERLRDSLLDIQARRRVQPDARRAGGGVARTVAGIVA